MTEQEYIDLTDLQKVRIARKVLGDICVPNSKVIKEDSFSAVMKTLFEYE